MYVHETVRKHTLVWSLTLIGVGKLIPKPKYIPFVFHYMYMSSLFCFICYICRYKATADNIYVKYRTTTDNYAEICLHRCTKCSQCYLSLDLLAGHKLLDQCEAQPIQVV